MKDLKREILAYALQNSIEFGKADASKILPKLFQHGLEKKDIPEIMILITTLEAKLEDVNELISQNHTYAVPLIAGVDVRRINRAYKEWMTQEIV